MTGIHVPEPLFVCSVSLGGPVVQRGFRGREEACSRCSFLSVDLTAVWCTSASIIDVLLTCVFEREGWRGEGGGGGRRAAVTFSVQHGPASVMATPIKGCLLTVE